MHQLTYNLSYWERETFLNNIDVAVIGAGLVGLSAAIELRRRNPRLHVAVFERGTLPIGASTRNAGFACFGSMTELLDDVEEADEDEVLSVVELRWRGLQALRSLIGDAALDFQQHGGYEMFTDDDDEVYARCLEQMPHWNEQMQRITGHPEVYRKTDERIAAFGFQNIRHLIHNQAEGQVHTGRMMQALIKRAEAEGVHLFFGAGITHLEDSNQGVLLQSGFGWSILVPRVLVAVNGFAQQLLPGLEVTPARNQVLITRPIPDLRLEGCFHYDRGYYYFRNIDNRILLGGGRNLALQEETTSQFGNNELIRSALVRLLKTVICPGCTADVDYWWSGILGLGPVRRPLIRRTGPNTVVAVRLSGMGVAIGTLVGQEGARMTLA
ncbi:MAG: FAD-dependent oxidoreductase [Saprospiraceae bacterium]|nr:FAD-dependent oxidoreductase [Saprospiraceae bacterium]